MTHRNPLRDPGRRSCPRIIVLLALLALAALAPSGCGEPPIGVRRSGLERVFAETTAYAVNGDVPSQYSKHILARSNLLVEFDDRPAEVLEKLRTTIGDPPDRDQVFALAELSYLTGRRLDARKHYLASTVYAYLYLFDPRSRAVLEPFDPRFRMAAYLYNCGLTQFLRDSHGEADIESGIFELPVGKLTIRATRPGFPGEFEDFNRFVPALDFSVHGLRTRNRVAGLGSPLIGIRAPIEKKKEQAAGKRTSATDYLGPNLKVSATAFLRLTGQEKRDGFSHLSADLELYSPYNTNQVQIEGLSIPLEEDLTAPLAYALKEPKIWKFEIGGLLSGESSFRNGIYFLQPYTPGKIPVVLVHGTASSPARWAEMFNELYAYRDIREKFQFWFFLYNTGFPIISSGQKLRDALREAVSQIDPEGKDPALRQMVLAGHSQGGLLVKMQVSDSKDVFYDQEIQKKVEELELNQEEIDELKALFIFKPLPFIRRAVFIATPHQGSYLSGGWGSRILTSIIGTPGKLKDFAHRLVTDEKTGLPKGLPIRIPTSIENMEPGNRFVVKLASLPIDPRVKAHSIIPVDAEGPLEEGVDGVVAWKSAHIEPVESEYIVRSGHSCQSNPLTILEFRRILLEHLKSVAAETAAQGD